MTAKTLYHKQDTLTTTQTELVVEKFVSYYALVENTTFTGVFLKLFLENNYFVRAFAYGNYSIGDKLMVSVHRIFNDNRYPLCIVEHVCTIHTRVA